MTSKAQEQWIVRRVKFSAHGYEQDVKYYGPFDELAALREADELSQEMSDFGVRAEAVQLQPARSPVT